MYCADCGAKMYVHRTNNGKRIAQYTCSAYTKVPVGKLCPTQHRVNENNVLQLIKELLKSIAEYSKLDHDAFVRTVMAAYENQSSSEIIKIKETLESHKRRLGELEKLICRIYEDNILGKLPDDRYNSLSSAYEGERNKIIDEVESLEASFKKNQDNNVDAERFLKIIDKYENFDELTNTMVFELVDKILVHERDVKGSSTSTQQIDIYFNFIGNFVPPAEVCEPTQEEVEKMEKQRKQREKNHAAYLRRKENGWQKKYEARIKEEKKAKIEEMKKQLREEDREKGVFLIAADSPEGTPTIIKNKEAYDVSA